MLTLIISVSAGICSITCISLIYYIKKRTEDQRYQNLIDNFHKDFNQRLTVYDIQ